MSSFARALADRSNSAGGGGGGWGEGAEGHSLTALRMPRSGDSASFHTAGPPEWAFSPSLSLVSEALPGFASHSRNPHWQEGCLLSPSRACFSCPCVSPCIPVPGGPRHGEPSGSGCQWSFMSPGQPLKPSGPQSLHPQKGLTPPLPTSEHCRANICSRKGGEACAKTGGPDTGPVKCLSRLLTPASPSFLYPAPAPSLECPGKEHSMSHQEK